MWQFDHTDMQRAKEILGGVACIQGNVPYHAAIGHRRRKSGLLPDLIEALGPGGGFILDVGAVVDEAKPENMQAMIRAAKEIRTSTEW